ncbi:hypothetical protein Rs2_44390 [Raphanus sativus]|nr:hypothetical protein Rs2_48044 [Raphanus sativus]KAJ4873580.1 hypothetical protein Rs2_44716 [Raphanus sativus]KAJ4873861.1 hypothetical protein Rs2_44390 [Raphanus sativus]
MSLLSSPVSDVVCNLTLCCDLVDSEKIWPSRKGSSLLSPKLSNGSLLTSLSVGLFLVEATKPLVGVVRCLRECLSSVCRIIPWFFGDSRSASPRTEKKKVRFPLLYLVTGHVGGFTCP